MRYILLIIFTIAIYFTGSYLGVNTETGSMEEKQSLRAANVKTSDNYRKNSESEAYQKIGFIEEVGTKNNASENLEESRFVSETAREQNSSFELIFFLSMITFTAFLVILHFYSYNEKVRKYQRFDRSLSKTIQITNCDLSIQGCDL